MYPFLYIRIYKGGVYKRRYRKKNPGQFRPGFQKMVVLIKLIIC
jgi:hypothetical protein